MAERFLVAVDLENLQNGLDLKTISFLNLVYIDVLPQNYQKALQFLEDYFHQCTVYCDCTALENWEDIISLLNLGATKVFVTYQQLKALVEKHLVVGQDVSRLILSFPQPECEGDIDNVTERIQSKVKALALDVMIGIRFYNVYDWRLVSAISRMSKDGGFANRYLTLAKNTRDSYTRTVKDGHVAIMPAKELTTDPKQSPNLLPASLLLTATIQSDRTDGLFPTIVADERGVCLGLVYSNEESIETALRLGCGAYHSRRHGLWVKGQKSGNTQELISIALDCDADALQFNVRQKGQGN